MKIKWIVLDMDGTLLNSNKELPSTFFKVKEELEQLGIKFILASGRQYARMQEVMKPFEDDFIYLSDNGSVVYQDNQRILDVTIDDKVSQDLLKTSYQTMDVHYVINTIEGAHFLNSLDKDIKRQFDEFYKQQIFVDSFDDLKGIVKISCFHPEDDFSGSENLEIYNDQVNITHSGATWLDIVDKNISKGIALETIAKTHQIDLNEIMVFGDAMNDADMLSVAGYPIIMENADERLKNLGYYQTASNDEEGVMVILNKLLENEGNPNWLKK